MRRLVGSCRSFYLLFDKLRSPGSQFRVQNLG